MKKIVSFLAASIVGLASAPLFAQADEAGAPPKSEAEQLPDADQEVIVVTGETDREVVEALGKAITRSSRAGQPVARFDAPICVKVAGMPDVMADLVKERIEANAHDIRGLEVDEAADCNPNAFVGVLNDVTESVDTLRQEEKWLFEGLLSYQIDRIYKGSDAVRAWHVFDLRNADGSQIPGKRRGASDSSSISSAINKVEKSSRIAQLRNDLVGAVVLVETAALEGMTLRQLADYATFRIFASVSDEVDTSRTNLPTILTLFGPGLPPRELTDFDHAYLESLYELPANSRDGQVIAAAVSRYVAKFEENEH